MSTPQLSPLVQSYSSRSQQPISRIQTTASPYFSNLELLSGVQTSKKETPEGLLIVSNVKSKLKVEQHCPSHRQRTYFSNFHLKKVKIGQNLTQVN